MDAFIDTIEWIAAGFVGLVAIDIFNGRVSRDAAVQLSPVLRDRGDRGGRHIGSNVPAVHRAGRLRGLLRPHWLPTAPVANWAERFNALKDIWASLALFISVIGGLHGGLFTPTEAGGMGAGGTFPIGLARQRLTREDIRQALLQVARTAVAMFTVPIGAILFGYFLTVMQTPRNGTAFVTGLGLGRYGVLVVIMGMYLMLGCLMDAMAMIVLTVPIIFPVITECGFDPVWFGVIIVMTTRIP